MLTAMLEVTLESLVRERGRPESLAWIEEAARDVRGSFSAVGRNVGRGPLETRTELTVGEERVPLVAWRVDDAARVLLLLRAKADIALAAELYFQGDAREKTGALRALSLLPDNPSGVSLVLDAMRVNQGEIFEAAILDNPYASRHLPQHEWRKAVMKSVFLGYSIMRIARVEARADAELAQSLLDYVLEREAATRTVPPEIWPVMARFPPPGLVAKLLGYLEHPAVEHRVSAAAALVALGDERVRPFVADRAEREPDPVVRAAILALLQPEP